LINKIPKDSQGIWRFPNYLGIWGFPKYQRIWGIPQIHRNLENSPNTGDSGEFLKSEGSFFSIQENFSNA